MSDWLDREDQPSASAAEEEPLSLSREREDDELSRLEAERLWSPLLLRLEGDWRPEDERELDVGDRRLEDLELAWDWAMGIFLLVPEDWKSGAKAAGDFG